MLKYIGVVLCAVLLWGCSKEEPTTATCVEGRVVACFCTGSGPEGSQVCQADGTYGACRCGMAMDMLTQKDAGDDQGQGKKDVTSDDVGNPPEDMKMVSGVVGFEMIERLLGLWSGAATATPLGNFPVMNMDLRPASERVLFSRVDLDVDNALRFAFFVETIGGKDVLVYRNGGLFLGLERDTKTVLVEHSEDTYKFCHPTRGCEYVESNWVFDGDKKLNLNVKVRGMQHLTWDASRVEERQVAGGFPVDDKSIGTGDAPFPEMPSLKIDVSVGMALPMETFVWVVLSDTTCGLTGMDCESSRSIAVKIPADAMSGSVQIDQIHAGQYYINGVHDRNGNFRTTPFPESGDAIVWPVDRQIEVGMEGMSTTSISATFTVP